MAARKAKLAKAFPAKFESIVQEIVKAHEKQGAPERSQSQGKDRVLSQPNQPQPEDMTEEPEEETLNEEQQAQAAKNLDSQKRAAKKISKAAPTPTGEGAEEEGAEGEGAEGEGAEGEGAEGEGAEGEGAEGEEAEGEEGEKEEEEAEGEEGEKEEEGEGEEGEKEEEGEGEEKEKEEEAAEEETTAKKVQPEAEGAAAPEAGAGKEKEEEKTEGEEKQEEEEERKKKLEEEKKEATEQKSQKEKEKKDKAEKKKKDEPAQNKNFYWGLTVCLNIFVDILDILVEIGIVEVGIIISWVIQPMISVGSYLLLKKLGTSKNKVEHQKRVIQATVVSFFAELIPVIDLMVWSTLSVLWLWYVSSSKEKAEKGSEGQKEKEKK